MLQTVLFRKRLKKTQYVCLLMVNFLAVHWLTKYKKDPPSKPSFITHEFLIIKNKINLQTFILYMNYWLLKTKLTWNLITTSKRFN